ncbi:TlpA disulfide reductase family protein [Mucilaginibacter myungsuensis]|uniref:AhpC/TSA family protein n=1 Tax=Mucilaginibacter myungsuensis TaxID=649104 RepID=A0A929KZI0_9SPHI|nr:TlpA disulfide reductase family protein [Mucilaginibacter myungsuensis]MBE9661739.1 AhpC/TSA family protein [Mucilaginibacter myungsuensis]MDN3599829.1 TlpA disulfide reductase family protein [Mucilaginibacter myungsuensis]
MKFQIDCYLVACLLFSIIFSSCKQPDASKGAAKVDSGKYVVNGTFKGVDSGTIYISSSGKKVDSARIVNGKFVFSGQISFPEKKQFTATPGNWAFHAFVDAPNIKLNIDTAFAIHQWVDKTTDQPMIQIISETGSPIGDAYTAYFDETGITKYFDLFREQKTASRERIEGLEKQMDSIMEASTIKQRTWIERYVPQNPSSVGGALIFDEYISMAPGVSAIYLGSIVDKFSGAAKASPYYASINKKLSALGGLRLGKTSPNFTLSQRDGSKLSLADKRGSVILLDFWASWCIPCRKDIPHWKKIYDRYHPKGVDMISISIDDEQQNWTHALDQEKMPWRQVIDKWTPKSSLSVTADQYGVLSIPFYVLLNKKGEIIAASGNHNEITAKLEEVLAVN